MLNDWHIDNDEVRGAMNRTKKKNKKKKAELQIKELYKKISDRKDIEIIYSEIKFDNKPLSESVDIVLPVLITLIIETMIDGKYIAVVGLFFAFAYLIFNVKFTLSTGKRSLYIIVKVEEKYISNFKDSKFLFENFDYIDNPLPGLVTFKSKAVIRRGKAKELAEEMKITFR